MDSNAISNDVVRPEVQMESAPASSLKAALVAEEGINGNVNVNAASGAATQLANERLRASQARPGAVSVASAAPQGKRAYTTIASASPGAVFVSSPAPQGKRSYTAKSTRNDLSHVAAETQTVEEPGTLPDGPPMEFVQSSVTTPRSVAGSVSVSTTAATTPQGKSQARRVSRRGKKGSEAGTGTPPESSGTDKKAVLRAQMQSLRNRLGGPTTTPGAVAVAVADADLSSSTTSASVVQAARPGAVSVSSAAPQGKRAYTTKSSDLSNVAAERQSAVEGAENIPDGPPMEFVQSSGGQSNSNSQVVVRPGAVSFSTPAPQGKKERGSRREKNKGVTSSQGESVDGAGMDTTAPGGVPPLATRKLDEKAVIREEMKALRNLVGPTATPGAVAVADLSSSNNSASVVQANSSPGVVSVSSAAPQGKRSVRDEISALRRTQGQNVSPNADRSITSAKPTTEMEDKLLSKMESNPAKPRNVTPQSRLTKMEEKIMSMEAETTGSKPETGPMALDVKGSSMSLKEEKKTAMGVPAGEEYFDEQRNVGDENLISAQVVDEDELEAEYHERMMENAVAAEVVSEDELKKKGRCCRATLCCLCIGVILAIAIPLTLKSPDLTYAPTSAPTPQSEYEFLEDIFLPISGDVLFNETTPQYQALNWLAFDDPAMLPLKQTNTSILIGRYVLAVVYYSTGGPDWFDQMHFLSNRSFCDWQPEKPSGKTRILCFEDQENLRVLVLGKCWFGFAKVA
jgi:hypothetical protein